MKKLCLFIILAAISFSYSFADTTYVVQKGDTLYSLSKKFQLTVGELRAANNLSESDVIKVGQKITIPEADIGTAAALSSTNSKSISNSTKTKVYTVQKGDTLYSLARKNNISVADLMVLNNFDSSKVIKIGEKIKIPDLAVASGKTTVTNASNNSTSANSNKSVSEKIPDTRNYGNTITADSNTKIGTAGLDSITGKSQITFMVFQNGQPIDPSKAPRN